MDKPELRTRSLLLIPLLSALLLAGCWDPFKPRVIPYTAGGLGQEEKLIVNLQYAYNNKDITRYVSLLADTFIFRFADLDSAYLKSKNIQLPYWGRSDEENSARGLFAYADQINLQIQPGTWQTNSGDPSGQSKKTRRYYTLDIQPTPPEIGNAAGYATFIIQRDATGAWRIVRWDDEVLL
jgi:hypothetical protein